MAPPCDEIDEARGVHPQAAKLLFDLTDVNIRQVLNAETIPLMMWNHPGGNARSRCGSWNNGLAIST